MIKIKRTYEIEDKKDGYRILIDRLWPRGIKKADFNFDEWVKDLAPSTELRKEFGHDPDKWEEFKKEYMLELRSTEALRKIKDLAKKAEKKTVTLLYSAHDKDHNNAVVLKSVVEKAIKKL